jgi:glycine oxidase
MSSHADVVVIGGGVIGLSIAYALAKEGVRVTLTDKGDFGQESSWAGAGIISPGNPKRARNPLNQLRALSASLFPGFSAELRELAGIDNGYRKCGGLELGRSEDALEKQRLDNLLREERGEGAVCDVLTGDALRQCEAALSHDISGAVYFPDMAQVRNPRHVKALVAACTARGVAMLPDTPVHGLERQGDRITRARNVSGDLHADRFLLTAGAWTDGLLAGLGIETGIAPVRGQIALLRTPAPLLRHILQCGSEYLVPRDDGRVLAGSTEEHVGFDKRTTAEAIGALLAMAVRLVPGLASATVERCWAGLRPGSPAGRPVLGGVPGTHNLYVAAGHFRSGIMLSPGTAQVMADVLQGRQPVIPLDSFRLER